MKFNLIDHTEGCRRLLLIYSGWSTDAVFYRNIKRRGWDVGVVTDYSDMNLDSSFLDEYDTIWVLAWSLGVKAASVSLPSERIAAAYAINGTLRPYSDTHGIPESIYDGTLENLTPRNLMKFQLRMVGDKSVYNELFGNVNYEGKIEKLQHELAQIRDCKVSISEFPWRKAFISEDDRIFPVANMVNSWNEENVECVKVKAPHFIDLNQVVSWIVPDVESIAEKFSQSSDSYLGNATAQRQIAERLTNLLPDEVCDESLLLDTLELGPGKGLFTHLYSSKIGIKRASFVDIVALDKFCIAQVERYFKQDAETYLNECNDKFDIILSSSAVQWFTNFKRFLQNSYRLLNKNGILCFSTFAKGNLSELDSVRISPLYYHSANELEDMVSEVFGSCKIIEDEIVLNFDSPRDLMMHLKLTGVSGFSASGDVTPFKLRNVHTLTFRPVYVIAGKN